MDEWKEKLMARLDKLVRDRQHIIELDHRLAYENLISDKDRETFASVLRSVDREIEEIQFELILDDMLASELPLDKFLEKYKNL